LQLYSRHIPIIINNIRGPKKPPLALRNINFNVGAKYLNFENFPEADSAAKSTYATNSERTDWEVGGNWAKCSVKYTSNRYGGNSEIFLNSAGVGAEAKHDFESTPSPPLTHGQEARLRHGEFRQTKKRNFKLKV
jgi:hypothetical protein